MKTLSAEIDQFYYYQTNESSVFVSDVCVMYTRLPESNAFCACKNILSQQYYAIVDELM